MKTSIIEQICHLQDMKNIPFEWFNPDGTFRNLDNEIEKLKEQLT